jgi:hypothetical protein
MATIHLVDLDGREHWADADSEFAKSGLESGHLRPAGEPATEQVEETGEEAEDATVEQDGDGADADGDSDGSGQSRRSPRGSRRR